MKNHIEKWMRRNRTSLLLAVLLIAFLVAKNANVSSSMRQLPSPLYGGDLYYQMGCINHIRYGGNPFENSNLLSPNPGYLPAYGVAVAYFSNFLGYSTLKGEIVFSSVARGLSIIISFILFLRLFKDPYISALGVMMFLKFEQPIFKYTEFALCVSAPLFILTLHYFYDKKSYNAAILLGIAAGIGTLSHSVFLPVSFFIMGVFSLYILNNCTVKKADFAYFTSSSKKLLPMMTAAFLIAFSISLLYWMGPIMKLGKTSPHYLEWNGPGDLSNTNLQFAILSGTIKSIMFRTDSLLGIISSVLAWGGVFFLATVKNKSKEQSFSYLLLASLLLVTFSYFITIPTLGIHFVPDYVVYVFGIVVTIYLLTTVRMVKTLVEKTGKHRNHFVVSVVVLIMAVALMHIEAIRTYKKDRWYQVSSSPLDNAKQELQAFVDKNTGVNDVILTTKEIGFSVNALTGRKLLVARRAQNDAFEDMDPREMDAAVILYGNNTELKKHLIKKHAIGYLYWDYNWISSEFNLDKEGHVRGWLDPLIAFDNPDYRDYLTSNHVSFAVRNTYVDPSLKSKYHPTFDLIMVSPANYHNPVHPWNPDLDPYLQEVWSARIGGNKVAILYKILV